MGIHSAGALTAIELEIGNWELGIGYWPFAGLYREVERRARGTPSLAKETDKSAANRLRKRRHQREPVASESTQESTELRTTFGTGKTIDLGREVVADWRMPETRHIKNGRHERISNSLRQVARRRGFRRRINRVDRNSGHVATLTVLPAGTAVGGIGAVAGFARISATSHGPAGDLRFLATRRGNCRRLIRTTRTVRHLRRTTSPLGRHGSRRFGLTFVRRLPATAAIRRSRRVGNEHREDQQYGG